MTPPDNAPEETANLIWGEGNWVRCAPCPKNDGHASIHHRDFHDNFEAPTATLTRIPASRHPSMQEAMYCGESFYEKDHRHPMPWLCEQEHGHQGRHGIPRMDLWGPEPA